MSLIQNTKIVPTVFQYTPNIYFTLNILTAVSSLSSGFGENSRFRAGICFLLEKYYFFIKKNISLPGSENMVRIFEPVGDEVPQRSCR